jgi:5-methylcytosine-specific restriction protein B
VRGIRPVADGAGNARFEVVDGVFKRLCDEARANPSKRYAMLIDEINRANLAKVFGDLISLIDLDKRIVVAPDGSVVSGLSVILPGGSADGTMEEEFGVPSNIDIFGTMNSADRSTAMLDVALRRRFTFKEFWPDETILPADIQGIDVSKFLDVINQRIAYLLDRDHQLGHSYFLKCLTVSDLRSVLQAQVIPLLNEYFFDDLAKVAAVLQTSGPPFVVAKEIDGEKLFGGVLEAGMPGKRTTHSMADPDSWTPDSFKGVYAAAEEDAE